MIEPGQLRRWLPDASLTGDFLIVRSQGKFLPPGSSRTDKKQDHWEILTTDGPGTGWNDDLLNNLSEPINETR